ncbi:MAG: protein kinase domain-containing protein [Planctomycetota bacterium]
MPILRVIEGPDQGKELPLNLKKGQLFCGAGKKTTFRLKDDDVAEKHFRLVKDGDDLTIYNLDADNSLEVNDESVEGETSLSVGDTIRLGASVLEIAPPEEKEKNKSSKKSKKKDSGKSKGKKKKKKKLKVGSEVAGCEIEEKIGESSGCLVFKAVQKSLDRHVALKVLRPEVAEDKEAAEEFLSKARKAAKTAHDKIVQTYDVGEEDGFYYLINEYMSGGSLADLVEDDSTLKKADLSELINSLSEAVEFIHSKGVVHGAIRPENVMFNDDKEVKLSDLRIAGFAADAASDMSRVHCAAPEISLDDREESEEADLYSLGVVIYEAATADTPYVAHDIDDLRDKQRSGEFKSLKGNTALSKDSISAVEKLLSPKPGDRFVSAGEFVKALGNSTEQSKKSSRIKSKGKGYNKKVKSRSPSMSAAQIIKSKKQKAKEGKGVKPVHLIIGFIVLGIVGVGVYVIQMPDPVQKAYLRADVLIDEGRLEEALAVIKKTNKSWPSKYLAKLEEKESKLSSLIASKPEFEELNKQWRDYIRAKRAGDIGVSERKQKCITLLGRAEKNAFAVEKKLTVAIKSELKRIDKEE